MAEINRSRKWLMNYPDLFARAREALAQLSPIDPTVLVGTLSISQQQLVEIAKALTLDCRILILDEPTAALTDRETRVLFGIMRQLAARGISIIYISHRLVEIFDNCDRVIDLPGRAAHRHRRGSGDQPRTTRQTTWSAASSASSTRRSRARRSAAGRADEGRGASPTATASVTSILRSAGARSLASPG